MGPRAGSVTPDKNKLWVGKCCVRLSCQHLVALHNCGAWNFDLCPRKPLESQLFIQIYTISRFEKKLLSACKNRTTCIMQSVLQYRAAVLETHSSSLHQTFISLKQQTQAFETMTTSKTWQPWQKVCQAFPIGRLPVEMQCLSRQGQIQTTGPKHDKLFANQTRLLLKEKTKEKQHHILIVLTIRLSS